MLQHTANISANLGVLIKNYFIYFQKHLTSKNLKITQIYFIWTNKRPVDVLSTSCTLPIYIFKNYSFNLSFKVPDRENVSWKGFYETTNVVS